MSAKSKAGQERLRPLSDRVVVKRGEREDVTKGGILLPDNAKEKPARGEVLAVGPGKLNDQGERVAMQVKRGDVVVFNRYSGTAYGEGDAEVLVLREDDVMAVLE